jgi:hypothetical protein
MGLNASAVDSPSFVARMSRVLWVLRVRRLRDRVDRPRTDGGLSALTGVNLEGRGRAPNGLRHHRDRCAFE